MKEILYLSFDSLQEGVGASQVLAYMRKIVKIRSVTIISFEKNMPTIELQDQVQQDGLNWVPLPFGRFGVVGGINRVVRMSRVIDRGKIIHARSTSAGIAALIRFPRMWIWDCRSLQADQRLALSVNKRKSLGFFLLRVSEYLLAKQSKSIIVITKAVIPVLIHRYKTSERKIHCIPTCVDTVKFSEKPLGDVSEIRILLAGTFSQAYDLELTNKIIREMKRYRTVKVTIAASTGDTGLWKTIDFDQVISVKHGEMPQIIQGHHIGMSIWKNDLGICLTSVASTKTAEFLACGRPVFINSLQGDFGDVIEQGMVGVVTSGSSTELVADYTKQILELINDPALARRCHTVAVERFNLDAGVQILQKIYSTFDTTQ